MNRHGVMLKRRIARRPQQEALEIDIEEAIPERVQELLHNQALWAIDLGHERLKDDAGVARSSDARAPCIT